MITKKPIRMMMLQMKIALINHNNTDDDDDDETVHIHHIVFRIIVVPLVQQCHHQHYHQHFGLEILSLILSEARLAQWEFTQFAAGICEFHHKQHVHDIFG